MRDWSPPMLNGSTASLVEKNAGPELVLEPLHHSPTNTSTQSKSGTWTISVSDIVVVDVQGLRCSGPLYMTTLHQGTFEYMFSTANAHDVLLAFLNARLPRARISRSTPKALSSPGISESDCSFDVEAFTAKKLQEKIRTEPWTEKMRRRVWRIADRLEEISETMTDCACGCDPRSMQPESRQSPQRDLRQGYQKDVRLPSALSLEASEMDTPRV
eukprot:CAMPEP_0116849720 /NCGR_PEP_ID=MMETSP0418-20121206/15742_1 /TAXON_ID=1158023 /ORGANISM="Astrosyne radiata, Strain 13vi08-1A" /LENGTH=214 /DNA_ID=CAMNT_0004481499 /DNA_START=109 /DNA_END=753 /DNA_ORIENTATION=-